MSLFGTDLTEQEVLSITGKWIPQLQELDPDDKWGTGEYLYRAQELGADEYYVDIMGIGLSIFSHQNTPVPEEFIEDIKKFLPPSREEDYAAQKASDTTSMNSESTHKKQVPRPLLASRLFKVALLFQGHGGLAPAIPPP